MWKNAVDTPAAGLEIRQIRVEPPQQDARRTDAGDFDPETANLRFLEDVVAAKHFVGAFAGEDDLAAAVAHELREQEHRRRRRAQQRRLGVPDTSGKDPADVGRGAAHLGVIG